MFLIILIHLSYLGLGLVAIRFIFKHYEYPCILRLTVGYFVGIFVNVGLIQVFLISKLTSPLISWSLLFIGLIGLIIEVSYAIKTKAKKPKISFGSKKKMILNACIFMLLIPTILLITLKLVCLPDVTYDSTCFWNLKSKYFFYGEHLLTDAFMDTNRVHPHRGYPLYMPIVIFEHYSIIGAADDWLTKYGVWIYYTVGMVLFFMLIREWTSTTITLLSFVIMLYSPLYSYKAGAGTIASTYMDFPLSLMFAASIGLFLRYQIYKCPIDIFGACVFVASAVLLKREGTAWLGLFVSFSLIAMVVRKKKLWNNEYAWLFLPILTFIFWKLISTKLPAESDLERPDLAQLYHMAYVVPKMIRVWIISIFDYKFWGFFPFFVIPFFIIGLVRSFRHLTILFPAFMVLGYLVTIFLSSCLLTFKLEIFTIILSGHILDLLCNYYQAVSCYQL